MPSIDKGRNESSARQLSAPDKPISAIAAALERLRYGAVQVVVHDGKVVQLEVTERQRFT